MQDSTHPLPEYAAYLHDARCLDITWDCSGSDDREIRMTVVVDPDAGLPAWNGKTLTITLSGVFAVRYVGWIVVGSECIDSWWESVSDVLERDCIALTAKSLETQISRFTITFSSGSEMEVICTGASVSLVEES